MAPPNESGEEQAILLAEELLRLHRRRVETGRVIVRTSIETRDETVDLPRLRRDVTVERVPVDRVVEAAPPVRQEEDGTVVVPVLEEVLVVEKRLVLREEIRIRRREQVLPHQETVRLRREQATVERRAPDPGRGSTTEEEDDMGTTTGMSTTTGATAPLGADDGQLTAMFDTYEQARQARDALIAQGVAAGGIDIIDNNAEVSDSSFAYERNETGVWGAIKNFFLPEEDAHHYAEGVTRGHAMLVVRPAPGTHDRVIETIERFNPIDYDTRTSEWKRAGWSGLHAGQADYDSRYASGLMQEPATPAASQTVPGLAVTQATDAPVTGAGVARTGVTGTGNAAASGAGVANARSTSVAGAAGTAATDLATGRDEVIPIVEESLRVGKRDVNRGTVRVRSYVVSRPVEEQISLRDETVEVERRAVNRPVTDADDVFRERTISATETDEEAVVAKEAVVREELVLRKGVTEHTETVRDELRRTEVEVQDDRKTGASSVAGAAAAVPPGPARATRKP